ncbi:MAG: protein kinase [Muribaculaceae bacterium]|nr:protein kinase [Muribaculaceae bacterium]MDE7096350.1 protein kinase [Muribaculaceae bacterium]
MAAYISKDEKLIPISDPTGRWSELTLLPEWEEDIYDVYTVKKHGKWVMLKALKEQYRNDPEYRAIIEKEFDTRYNLAHPNIVMINDFEEVPGIGMAIVTDDAYGYSLRRLIDEKRLTPKIIQRLETQLPDALEYIQENHVMHQPITPDNVIFTEYNENLKLINVGYDHSDRLEAQDTKQDIINYGKLINEVLDNLPEQLPRLRKVAQKAVEPEGPINNVQELKMALRERSMTSIILWLLGFIIIMLGVLIVLSLQH